MLLNLHFKNIVVIITIKQCKGRGRVRQQTYPIEGAFASVCFLQLLKKSYLLR